MYCKPNRRSFVAGTAAGAALATFGIALAMAQAGPPPPSQSGTPVTAFTAVEASVGSLEAAYISGLTTARAITQAYLDRIAAYDKRGPFINSLITVNPRALEEADRLDALMQDDRSADRSPARHSGHRQRQHRRGRSADDVGFPGMEKLLPV